MLKFIKKIVLLPIITIAGVVVGLLLMLAGIDDWADFKAELKSLITYYWELY